MADIQDMLIRAAEIKNERDSGDNTAERVGSLLEDIIKHGEEQADTISQIELGTVLKQPLLGINAMQSVPSDGQSIRFRNGRWVFFTPSTGGGSDSSSAGVQRSYFLNVSNGITPQAPLPSNYNRGSDVFTTSGGSWTSSNINPSSGESTWAIWVWFSGDSPQSISGPIRIYDGSHSSSNGADSKEIEWVYKRTTELLTPNAITTESIMLANCTSAVNTAYKEKGALPSGWEDHPSGIDTTHKYEYAAFRVSSLDANNNRVWGNTGFEGPLLWSAYGEKGTDGDGVEYIFYATMGNTSLAGQRPDEWDASQDPEYTGPEGSNWEDEPIDLETLGQGAIEWVSMRKCTDGVWGKFSAPKVWSRLGKDGVVDGYIVDIVNDTMPVGTEFNGFVNNYTNKARVEVYYNGQPLSQETVTSGATPRLGTFDYVIDTAHIRRSDNKAINGHITTNRDGAQITVGIDSEGLSEFGGINAFIPITVYLPNGTSKALNITLFGVAVGEAGQTIDMWVSAKALRVDSNHSVAPSTINVGVKIGQGDSVKLYTGSNIPNEFTFKYWYIHSLPSDEIPIENTEKTFKPVAGIEEEGKWKSRSTVTVAMYYNGVFIDSEELPFINDGASGSTVKNVTRWYCAMSTMTIPAFTDEDSNGEPDGNIYSDQDSDGKNDTWTTERPEDYGENKPYLYAADVTEWSTGGYTVSPVWLLETYGSDAYDVVVEPSYLIFDGVYNNNGTLTGYNPSSLQIKVKAFDKDVPLYVNVSIESESGNTLCNVTKVQGQDDTIVVTPKTNVTTGSSDKISLKVIGKKNANGEELFTRSNVSVPVYINRAESKLFSIKGQLQNYTDTQIAQGLSGYVTQRTYDADIEATEKKLRSEYTETIRRAGDYNWNLFGFHKDVEFGRFVPFIQGYGIAIPQSLWVWNNYIGENGKYYGYIKNLGFNGVGGLFTISFKARTSSQYNKSVEFIFWTDKKCSNTNTVNINNSWKEYTLEYNLDLDVAGVTDTNAKNSIPEGELQICTSSNDFDLFIRELKIERGNIKTDFCEAEQDLADFDGTELATTLSIQDNSVMELVDTVDGKKNVYKTKNAINPTNFTNNFIDLIINAGTINVKSGEVYTLSYWAKTSSSSGIYISHYLDPVNGGNIIHDVSNAIYPEIISSADKGSIIAGIRKDGETHVRLSNVWKHYYVRYYVTTGTAISLIAFRVNKGVNQYGTNTYYGGNIYISDIRFQEGYAVEPNYYNSFINQTARGIALYQQTGLKKAGIDLANGTITLDANNTIATGNFYAPRVISENEDMMTTVEAGLLKVQSKKNLLSYGQFMINSIGEVVLQMFDKDGKLVIAVGGSSNKINDGEWASTPMRKAYKTSFDLIHHIPTRAEVTANAVGNSLCGSTQYYKLVLGVSKSGDVITYYLPGGSTQTSDSNVIAKDGYIYKGYGYNEDYIKDVDNLIEDGWYVYQNDGKFYQVNTSSSGSPVYTVTLYKYEGGKVTDTVIKQFT